MWFCLVSNVWSSCPSLLSHEITGRHHQAKISNILLLLKSLNSHCFCFIIFGAGSHVAQAGPQFPVKPKMTLPLLPPPPTKCWDHRSMCRHARLQQTVLGVVVLKSLPMELLQEKDKRQRKPRIRFQASWSKWGYQPWKPDLDPVTLEPRASLKHQVGTPQFSRTSLGNVFHMNYF